MPGKMQLQTWNMQGGNNWQQVEGLASGKPGCPMVICLQECGTPPNYKLLQTLPNGIQIYSVQIGTISRGSTFYLIYKEWGASNIRCSLAILGEAAYLDKWIGRTWLQNGSSDGTRPMLGLEVEKDCWVFCVHAPSGNHKAAAGHTAAQINRAVGQVSSNSPSWVCAGDFNAPPDLMKAYGFDVTAPSHATQQSGNILDYFVSTSDTTVEMMDCKSAVSDHYSVGARVNW